MFYIIFYILRVSPPLPPPPPPLSDFSPTINLTFWVSMGMNSQPPIPPCPAYPRLLISPWILQLAYSLYPLVTRGHQRPPPHTAGKFNPPILDMANPTPNPRFPPSTPCHAPPPLRLNGRVLVLTTSILVFTKGLLPKRLWFHVVHQSKHGHIRCNDFVIESCFRVHSSKISKQVNKCLFQTQWSICI